MEVHSDRTDGEIIAASLDSPTEFGHIFTRHHTRVYAFVARRLGETEAGDVSSEVFLKAFKLRYRYDIDRPNCLPWLYGIAQNTVGDRIRTTRRRDRVYLFLCRDSTVPGTEPADDRAVAQAVGAQLSKALRRLSAADRNAFLLYALEGFTYDEIGVTLGIPAGTVGSRIARARRNITEAIPDLRQIVDRMDAHQGPDDA